MLVKKASKRLSELRKIHLLVCKEWDKSFNLTKTMFAESTRRFDRMFQTPLLGHVLKRSGKFLIGFSRIRKK